MSEKYRRHKRIIVTSGLFAGSHGVLRRSLAANAVQIVLSYTPNLSYGSGDVVIIPTGQFKIGESRFVLTIENKTKWPTEFLEVVGEWIARRAGIDWKYRIGLSDGVRHGYGGRSYQNSYWERSDRRRFKWPIEHRDHRLTNSDGSSYGPPVVWQDAIESLVDLIAHECGHATIGHPDRFTRNGRLDKRSMEFACEKFARETLEAFREVRPELMRKIRAKIRKRRTAIIRRARLAADRQAVKGSDAGKLAKAQAALAVWQRKAKFAETKVKKYRRRVRFYERKTSRQTPAG